MNIVFSLYLDLIRFLAAFGVFIHHLSHHTISESYMWGRLGSYGQACVDIFFVLSGYVIAHVTQNSEKNLYAYATARVSRIYSVVIPALALTFLFDYFGQSYNPEFYANPLVLTDPVSTPSYMENLLLIHEFRGLGLTGAVAGSNGPFWSLSFEMCYYVLAGALIFLPRKLGVPVAIAVCIAAGKTISVLWPIWLLGYAAYFCSGAFRGRRYAAMAAFVISAALIADLNHVMAVAPDFNLGVRYLWARGQFNRYISEDYIIGILFFVHLIAAHEVLTNYTLWLTKVKTAIRRLGKLTFPLYLVHFPALFFFRSISPWPPASLDNVLFVGVPAFAIAVLATPLCDELKDRFRGMLKPKSRLAEERDSQAEPARKAA